jgi:hypothetical protein
MSSRQNRAKTLPPSPDLKLLSLAFAPKREDNIRILLKQLNDLTTHRFTGVYRFEPGWVVSVALWDRQNPDLEIGADVKMKESYCWLTGLGENTYVIEDACADERLNGHAAQQDVRAYVAVLLRDRQKKPWGTLCHFDFEPRGFDPKTMGQLEAYRPLIEEILVRDVASRWDPDAPSEPRRAQRAQSSAHTAVAGATTTSMIAGSRG